MPINPPNGHFGIPLRVAGRAAAHFAVDENGCHISSYSVASHGYAQIGWTEAGRRLCTTAHRASWVARNGQIPDGMTVDHTCRVRRCVNADHLRLLSNFENARRALYDWPVGTCRNGHPPSDLGRVGKRMRCLTCRSAQASRVNAA